MPVWNVYSETFSNSITTTASSILESPEVSRPFRWMFHSSTSFICNSVWFGGSRFGALFHEDWLSPSCDRTSAALLLRCHMSFGFCRKSKFLFQQEIPVVGNWPTYF